MSKPVDVVVCWWEAEYPDTRYPKIDRITESAHTLRLEVKRYPGVPSSSDMKHIVSIPYHAIMWWREEEPS